MNIICTPHHSFLLITKLNDYDNYNVIFKKNISPYNYLNILNSLNCNVVNKELNLLSKMQFILEGDI